MKINNNIEPQYVSFEQAKWLIENGFISNESNQFFGNDGFSRNKNNYNMNCKPVDSYIERPTQDLVIEWLRLNYNLWVYCESHLIDNKVKFGAIISYCGLDKFNSLFNHPIEVPNSFNTPQEAYLKAFDYIRLNNII